MLSLVAGDNRSAGSSRRVTIKSAALFAFLFLLNGDLGYLFMSLALRHLYSGIGPVRC